MLSAVKELFSGLLKSRKFFLTMCSIAVWGVGKSHLELDAETVNNVMYALWILVGGIALEDFGKRQLKP